MKKLYFTACALGALTFAACSDDDNRQPVMTEPTVISFEEGEAMIDRLGDPVVLGRVQVEGWTPFALSLIHI